MLQPLNTHSLLRPRLHFRKHFRRCRLRQLLRPRSKVCENMLKLMRLRQTRNNIPSRTFLFVSTREVKQSEGREQTHSCDERRKEDTSSLRPGWSFPRGSSAGRPVISVSYFPQQNLPQKQYIFLLCYCPPPKRCADACTQFWCNSWWAGAVGNPTIFFRGVLLIQQKQMFF